MRYKQLIYITFIAMLSACNNATTMHTESPFEPFTGRVSAEKLLRSNVTENYGDDEPYDPVKAHMKARQQVKPTDRSRTSQYTTAGPAPNESVHIRTIRINNAQDTGFSVAEAFIDSSPPTSQITQKPQQRSTSNFKLKPSAKPQKDSQPKQGEVKTSLPKPMYKPLKTSRNSGVMNRVENIRIGNHENKTRLVLDMIKPPTFTHSLKNNTIRIELKDAVWKPTQKKKYLGHPLLDSYKIDYTHTDKIVLQVQLKQSSTITMASVFPPNTQRKHYRIVMDIKPD